ncbi:MAG: hypothetical protein RLZ07_1398 [Pseudomonadota bacterium]|jgi:hypothetical protein
MRVMASLCLTLRHAYLCEGKVRDCLKLWPFLFVAVKRAEKL